MRADKFRAGYPDRLERRKKKIYSIRGSQLRRVAENPIRIRVPAMMDCRSYGKLSVKHNIDPRPLRPTPTNRRFTLAAAVRLRVVLCNVASPNTTVQTFSPSFFSLSPLLVERFVTISQMAHLHHRS